MESPPNKGLVYAYQTAVDTGSPTIAMLASQRRSMPTKRNHRALSTAGLVAIAYLLCCATPIGNEGMVAMGGPGTFFSVLVVFVLCYTLPFSYVVAELSSAFPDDGGAAIWVMNAFGPFWGFQTGYWIWVSLVCACATTPTDVYNRLAEQFGYVEDPMLVLAIKLSVALVLAIPSFFGVRVVGRLCKLLGLTVLVPFVMFTLVGYLRGHSWKDLTAVRRAESIPVNKSMNGNEVVVAFSGPLELQLSEVLRGIFYGFDGIVLISVFGGEVTNPAGTYTAAIFIKLAFHVVTYFFPFSSAVVFGQPAWYDWQYGSLLDMGKLMGPFMGTTLKISSHCSTVGFYVAGMFSQAYLLYGMADSQMLPRQMAQKSERFGMPLGAAFVGVLAVVICVVVDPLQMSSLASAFSALCQLMVIATIIRLRFVLPDAVRPTKVPGNAAVLTVLMVLPVCILGFMVYMVVKSNQTDKVTLVLVAIGFLLGAVFTQWQKPQQRQPQYPIEDEIDF